MDPRNLNIAKSHCLLQLTIAESLTVGLHQSCWGSIVKQNNLKVKISLPRQLNVHKN